MSRLFLITFFCFSSSFLHAGLGSLGKKPFLGAFVGHENRTSLYKILPNGVFQVDMLGKDGSAFHLGEIDLRFFLEEETGNSKWRWKKFDPALAESSQKPTTEPGKVEVVLTASNSAKVKLTFVFEKEVVSYDIELLDKGEAKGNLRIGYDLLLPSDLYPYIKPKDERDLKKLTKGAQITFTMADKKRVKSPMYLIASEVLEENKEALSKGITKVLIESPVFKRNEIEMTVLPKGGGSLSWEGKPGRKFYEGAKIRILADMTKGEGPLGTLRITK